MKFNEDISAALDWVESLAHIPVRTRKKIQYDMLEMYDNGYNYLFTESSVKNNSSYSIVMQKDKERVIISVPKNG